jgi:crotonobetainyl-CoA:carnitine CoA-transferase CaiB-like acyl-CoA transferase
MDFYQLDPFDMPQEEADLISQPVADFFKGHTVEELYREAIRRRILLYPVSTVRDLLRNEQLRERGYFQEVAHPELGRGIVYPGPFARLRETPIRFRRPPPRIGEHNREIYQGEMGLSAGELRTLREAGVI